MAELGLDYNQKAKSERVRRVSTRTGGRFLLWQTKSLISEEIELQRKKLNETQILLNQRYYSKDP